MPESGGHQLEEPKQSQATSKRGERLQGRQQTVDGVIEGTKGGRESRYHNPDLLHQLIGPRNKIHVVVNEELVKGLVDSGAQISAISMEFVKRHDLPIFQLQQLLDFEGLGGVDIPYIGYTELTLNIPEIEGFKREILAFVQKDSKKKYL